MAGWSQNRRGSGIWNLMDRLPSSSVHVWFMHDDGGRHGVMMEMPFGGHPVAVIEGVAIRSLRESSSGELADPTAVPMPDPSRCRSRSHTGTHSHG